MPGLSNVKKFVPTPGLATKGNFKVRKVIKPVKQKSSPMLDSLKMRYSSNTTNNARMAKWKAKDPTGSLAYNNKVKHSSPTTNTLISNNYQRSLYRPQ